MPLLQASEICVIGGGPAGLSAAIALSQAGYDVAVIDCATPPIDKACGEGLMPNSTEVLGRLGISIPPETGFRFRGVRFSDARSSVSADFPSGMGVGLRRTTLHSLLIRRAQELGVKVAWGVKDVRLASGGITIGREFLPCKLIVAADGQNSPLRRQGGLQNAVFERRRYGFRRHYRIVPWSPYMELHWGPKCQIYITPVAADEVCVASISRHPAVRLDSALTFFPELCSRLNGAPIVSSEMGALSVSRVLRRVYKDSLVLIGDASGSIDAVTGDGMGVAFKQSLELSKAVQAGDLQRYQLRHIRLNRRPRAMSALMLMLDKHPSFQKRALISLARHPTAFASLLGVHVGGQPVSGLLFWDLLHVCRAFLAA